MYSPVIDMWGAITSNNHNSIRSLANQCCATTEFQCRCNNNCNTTYTVASLLVTSNANAVNCATFSLLMDLVFIDKQNAKLLMNYMMFNFDSNNLQRFYDILDLFDPQCVAQYIYIDPTDGEDYGNIMHNIYNTGGKTAGCEAALVARFIELGVDPNYETTTHPERVMDIAIRKGDHAVVELLLIAGVDINPSPARLQDNWPIGILELLFYVYKNMTDNINRDKENAYNTLKLMINNGYEHFNKSYIIIHYADQRAWTHHTLLNALGWYNEPRFADLRNAISG